MQNYFNRSSVERLVRFDYLNFINVDFKRLFILCKKLNTSG